MRSPWLKFELIIYTLSRKIFGSTKLYKKTVDGDGPSNGVIDISANGSGDNSMDWKKFMAEED